MTNDNVELKACRECGMPCHSGEYHPYAACLMFKACGNSDTVRANIDAVMLHGSETIPRPDGRDDGLIEEIRHFIKYSKSAGGVAYDFLKVLEKVESALSQAGSGERIQKGDRCEHGILWPHECRDCEEESEHLFEPAKPKAEDGGLLELAEWWHEYGSGLMNTDNTAERVKGRTYIRCAKELSEALSSSQSGVDEELVQKLKWCLNHTSTTATDAIEGLQLAIKALGGGNE